MADVIDAFVEQGATRTFAGAVGWPGWARSGRGADDALANLGAFRDRYAAALQAAGVDGPTEGADLRIVEHLVGGASTDYGVVSASLATDEEPLSPADLDRQVRILEAAWAAFDRAAASAADRVLRVGPRGGGRDLDKMWAHVVESEQAYIGQLGVKAPRMTGEPRAPLAPLHLAAVDALRARARGELPDVGARGGRRWTARYFVRRAAWHAFDHAWEIEDRADLV